MKRYTIALCLVLLCLAAGAVTVQDTMTLWWAAETPAPRLVLIPPTNEEPGRATLVYTHSAGIKMAMTMEIRSWPDGWPEKEATLEGFAVVITALDPPQPQGQP